MRHTPAQSSMAQLCTGMRGFDSCASLAEGIARGRLGLTQITGCDFGYDIKAWFDHLAQHKMYDIACRSKPGNYPGFVLTALENPDWLNAVEQAEAGLEFETIRKELQRSQSARRDAELKWSGQERTCPKCKTSFTSIKDRGQCTQCGFVFLASNP